MDVKVDYGGEKETHARNESHDRKTDCEMITGESQRNGTTFRSLHTHFQTPAVSLARGRHFGA